MIRRSPSFVLLIAVAVAASGCSISRSVSYSLGALSGSVVSLSDSSSPWTQGARQRNYVSAVSFTTRNWARAGGDVPTLKRDVDKYATQYKIYDWENNPISYQAIGWGLKRSGAFGPTYEQLKNDIAEADFQRQDWIQQGYQGILSN